MTTRLVSVCIDANDIGRLSRFWATALGWDAQDGAETIEVRPTDGTSFILEFLPVPEPKTAKNPIHLDLVGESLQHRQEVVARLQTLGARIVDVGQGPEADHVVLADPEGNEFCVVLRGQFLVDTGFLGAVVFEPARPATGHFWSEATGWPVVYDENGDVAIRSPDGSGPFITFGPPGVSKHGRNRLHLDIAPDADDDQRSEVDRLIALGARRIDIGQGDVPWVVMADTDGNEFCVLTAR